MIDALKLAKKTTKFIGGAIISSGNKAVSKSTIWGLYEPEIPEKLKKGLNESKIKGF